MSSPDNAHSIAGGGVQPEELLDNVRIARGSGATNRNNPSLAEQPGEAALNANRDRGRNRTKVFRFNNCKVSWSGTTTTTTHHHHHHHHHHLK